VANTAVLALDEHPIKHSKQRFIEIANQVFSYIFCLEMIIKLIGMGFKMYFKDRFNTFDCIVVVISMVDIALQYSPIGSSQGNGAISAMRTFRLLRVFKLAKTWKQFWNLLLTIGKTLKDISNFSVLLFLFVFTYSLLGMDLFAYKVKFNEEDQYDLEDGSYPDSHFNTFLEAFVSVFIVLANDGWSTIYFNHYRSVGATSSTIFFISLLIFG